jgi:hypothetical protein
MSKRVLFGQFPDGNYGLRVSNPGVDVTSLSPNSVAGDNEKLIFNSDWLTTLPIFAQGVVEVQSNVSELAITYPDLGYVPFGMCWGNGGSTSITFSGTPDGPSPNQGTDSVLVAFRSNGIYISNPNSIPIVVSYAVFRVKAFSS